MKARCPRCGHTPEIICNDCARSEAETALHEALDSMRLSDIGASRSFVMRMSNAAEPLTINSVTTEQIRLLVLLERIAFGRATPERLAEYAAERSDWIRMAAKGATR